MYTLRNKSQWRTADLSAMLHAIDRLDYKRPHRAPTNFIIERSGAKENSGFRYNYIETDGQRSPVAIVQTDAHVILQDHATVSHVIALLLKLMYLDGDLRARARRLRDTERLIKTLTLKRGEPCQKRQKDRTTKPRRAG